MYNLNSLSFFPSMPSLLLCSNHKHWRLKAYVKWKDAFWPWILALKTTKHWTWKEAYTPSLSEENKRQTLGMWVVPSPASALSAAAAHIGEHFPDLHHLLFLLQLLMISLSKLLYKGQYWPKLLIQSITRKTKSRTEAKIKVGKEQLVPYCQEGPVESWPKIIWCSWNNWIGSFLPI